MNYVAGRDVCERITDFAYHACRARWAIGNQTTRLVVVPLWCAQGAIGATSRIAEANRGSPSMRQAPKVRAVLPTIAEMDEA